jgi:hypothetical protein
MLARVSVTRFTALLLLPTDLANLRSPCKMEMQGLMDSRKEIQFSIFFFFSQKDQSNRKIYGITQGNSILYIFFSSQKTRVTERSSSTFKAGKHVNYYIKTRMVDKQTLTRI